MKLGRVLKREFWRVVVKLLPLKKFRQELRAYEQQPFVEHKVYGRIYLPHYYSGEMSASLPQIYNKDGEKMEIFFLREDHTECAPYGESSKYFLWDRYNVSLKKHFYGGKYIIDVARQKKWAQGTERYALLRESEKIAPYDFLAFEKFKGIHNDFESVLTFSEKLLNILPNAKFLPAGTLFYSKEIFRGEKDPIEIEPNVWQLKDKNISMICSAKADTELHRLRQYFAGEVMREEKADVFGGYSPTGAFKFKSSTLQKYRYQIVVENDISSYYFTEKVIDCFASMTIPIYLGASKIGDFFNLNGIITIKKESDILKVLEQCSEKDYCDRLSAVKDNFERVKKYYNLDDLLYETLFKGVNLRV